MTIDLKPLKILIADDHALFRQGLALLLSQLFESVVVIEAKDTDEAASEIRQTADLDLALIDLHMPGMDGFRGFSRLHNTAPDLPLAILSMSDSVSDIQKAIEHGATGYVLKSSNDKILKTAITLMVKGQVYIPPHALTIFNNRPSGSVRASLQNSRMSTLTRREKEVLAQLMQGKSNKEIAAHLDILEGTVKKHMHALFEKLGAQNRTQATLIASELGWHQG